MVATVLARIAVALRCGYHDRTGRIIVAAELDDRSHQAPKRQQRDLLLKRC